jgi:hypothetical protein
MKPIPGIKQVSPYPDATLAFQTSDRTDRESHKAYNTTTEDVLKALQSNKIVKANELPYSLDARGYSTAYNNPELALKGFQQLKNGELLGFYDFETLGVAPHQQIGTNPSGNYFSATEIGISAKQYRFENGVHRLVDVKGRQASILVRPDKDSIAYAEQLLKRMTKSDKIALTDNDRRLVEDLTGYGLGAKTEVRKHKGQKYVALLEQAEKSQIKKSQYSFNDVRRARAGLETLKKATVFDDAIEIASTLLGDTRLAAYNNHSFDDPIMRHAIDTHIANAAKNGKTASSSVYALKHGMETKATLDIYSALKTVLQNPVTQLESVAQKGAGTFSGALTLENLTNYFNARAGIAHVGIADVLGLQGVFEKVMPLIQGFQLPNNQPLTSSAFKSDEMFKVGSELFSTKGMVIGERNPYDRVFDESGKPFDYSRAPISKKMSYTVQEILENVEIGGRKHVGVVLKGADGLTSAIFRQNHEELMQTIHGGFVRAKGFEHNKLIGDAQRSQAEYMKFFESWNGFNRLEDAYAVLDELGNKPMTKANIDAAVQSVEKKVKAKDPLRSVSSTLGDRFQLLKPILEAEQDIWKPALAKIGADQTLDVKAQTAALGHIKGILGQNEDEMKIEGEKFSTVKLPSYEEEFTFQSGTREQNRYKIKDFLMAGGKNMVSDQKARLGSFVNEAVKQLRLSKEEEKLLGIAKKSYHLALEKSGRVETAIDQIAQVITDFTNANGHEKLLMPATYQITDAYQESIANAKIQLDTHIENAKGIGSSIGYASKLFQKSSAIDQFVAAQDQRILNMFGMYTGNKFSETQLHSKYRTSVENLVKTYSKGFHVKLFTQDNSLAMVLMDKQKGVKELNGTKLSDFAGRSDAAIIQLPGYTEDGVVEYGKQRKTNTFRAVMVGDEMKFSTSVIHSINKINNEFDRVMESVKSAQIANGESIAEGVGKHFGIVGRRLNRRVRETIQKSATQYNRGYDQQNLFETGSAGKNFAGNSRLDIEDIAKYWYQMNIGELDGFTGSSDFTKEKLTKQGISQSKDKFSKVLERYEDQGRISFVESMSPATQRLFRLHAPGFIQKFSGLGVDMNAVNDRSISNFLLNFSGGDVRRLGFFSAYDEMANENLLKSINTYRMDPDKAKQKFQGENASRTKNYLTNELTNKLETDEVHYLHTQRVAMTDIELKAAMNDPAVKERIRLAMKDLNLPPSEKERIKTLLAQGRLSVYEGNALLSDKFKDAISYTREVRIAVDGELSDDMLQLIRSANPDFQTGMDFHSDEGVRVNQKMFKDGKLTVGKMTIRGEKEKAQETTRLLGEHRNYKLKAYNAADNLLVFDTVYGAVDGLKTVSHTGDRNINTFIPQQIIEAITGIKGAEGIVLPQKFSKGMGGAMVDGVVGYAMHHIEEQFGNHKGKKKELLSIMERDLGTHAGAVSINSEGQFVLQPGYEKRLIRDGFQGADFEKFQQNVKAFLDPDNKFGLRDSTFMLKGDRVGVHNVWDTQHGSGEGRVYMGLKESHVMQKKAVEFERLGLRGGRQYWNSFQANIEEKVNHSKREAYGDIWRAIGRSHTAGGFNPGMNDVVFDLSSAARDVQKGVQVDESGALRINALDPSIVKEIPKTTVQDLKYLSDEYTQTLLNPKSIQLPQDVKGMPANVKDVGEYLKYQLENSKEHGMQFVKLPDTFKTGTGASYYLPLINDDSISVPDTEIHLKGFQGNVRSIIEDVTAFNRLSINKSMPTEEHVQKERERLEEKIRSGLKAYDEKIGYMASSKDGTKDVFGARVSNSGHFQATGANPLDNYKFQGRDSKGDPIFKNTGAIKENVIRMNTQDLMDLTEGIEDNILKSWGVDDKQLQQFVVDAKSNKTLQQKHNWTMLDTDNWTEERRNRAARVYIAENLNEKGIYGLTGRWPVIDKATIQYTKFEADDYLERRQIMAGAGTAWRFNLDFDGDNIATMLTAYKDGDKAKFNHHFAEKAFQMEQQVSESFMSDVMKDVLGKMNPEDIDTLTVGKLTKDDPERWAKAKGLFESKFKEVYETKTMMARTGKGNIGIFDNLGRGIETRHFELSRLAEEQEVKDATSVQTGEIRQKHSIRRAAVEEISRALSQDSISSKKIDAKGGMQAAADQQARLMELRAQISSSHMDVNKAMDLFEKIGMYSPSDDTAMSTIESYEQINGRIQARKISQREMLEIGLQEIRKTNYTYAYTGTNTTADKVGHSLGTTTAKLRSAVQSQPESMTLASEYLNSGSDPVPFEDAIHLRQKARVNVYQGLENVGDAAYQALNESRQSVFSEPVPNSSLSKGVNGAIDNIMSQIANIANNQKVSTGGSKMGAVGGIGLMMGTFALGTVAGANAPTPEGLQEMKAVQGTQSQPTARIQVGPKNPQVTLSVRATSNRGHDPNGVADLVHQSVQEMSGMTMTQNVNVTDNSQDINQQWLQGLVANVINNGYAR